MLERFVKDVRRVVVRAAEEEVQGLGSATVEAEHLLLALAADEDGPAGRLLADSGLDHDAQLAALERESERSLASVGVSLTDLAPLRPTPPRRKPRFAASSKSALHRTLQVAVSGKGRYVTTSHLLVGILRADIGTVPRALEAGEVDRGQLLTRAERLLAR